MHHKLFRFSLTAAALALSAGPAMAHHVMGGRTPVSFVDGLLSGFGHPVIGLDHFAAVVAVGCLAAAHRAGSALALGFVLAMMAGVALHVQGTSVPAAELMVALSVIVLGAVMLRRQPIPGGVAFVLFAAAGLVHGYALGESIYGAEATPLYAYLLGLAAVQCAIALLAMTITCRVTSSSAEPAALRLVGAGIAGIGLAVLIQQIVPGA